MPGPHLSVQRATELWGRARHDCVMENLPRPAVIAANIVEDLEASVFEFPNLPAH